MWKVIMSPFIPPPPNAQEENVRFSVLRPPPPQTWTHHHWRGRSVWTFSGQHHLCLLWRNQMRRRRWRPEETSTTMTNSTFSPKIPWIPPGFIRGKSTSVNATCKCNAVLKVALCNDSMTQIVFRDKIAEGASLLDDKAELDNLKPLYKKYGSEFVESMYDKENEVLRQSTRNLFVFRFLGTTAAISNSWWQVRLCTSVSKWTQDCKG